MSSVEGAYFKAEKNPITCCYHDQDQKTDCCSKNSRSTAAPLRIPTGSLSRPGVDSSRLSEAPLGHSVPTQSITTQASGGSAAVLPEQGLGLVVPAAPSLHGTSASEPLQGCKRPLQSAEEEEASPTMGAGVMRMLFEEVSAAFRSAGEAAAPVRDPRSLPPPTLPPGTSRLPPPVPRLVRCQWAAARPSFQPMSRMHPHFPS